jgi:hypothetical protein
MNRLVVLLVLAAPAVGGDWQKRQSDFYAKQSAERKQLGLDAKTLRTKYGTPEVTFSGAGSGAGATATQCLQLCPGKTGKFVLKGKLPPGSVVIRSNDVEVLEEQQTSTGWEATVKAKADAPPQLLPIAAISAVSVIETSVPGLEIGCEHTYTFEVAGGETMVMKVKFPCGLHETTAEGEWRRAGKVLGSYTYQVSRSGHELILSRRVPQEETMAEGQGMMNLMQSKEWQALDARFNAQMAKVQACTKGPQAQMASCMNALQPEIDKITKERQALMDANQEKGSLKFGCGALDVEANAGTLKGTATQCAGHKRDDRVPVTGKYTSP